MEYMENPLLSPSDIPKHHKQEQTYQDRPSDVDIMQMMPQSEDTMDIFEVVHVKDEDKQNRKSKLDVSDRRDDSFLTPPESVVEEVVAEVDDDEDLE